MYLSTFISGAALFQLSIAGYVLEDDYMKDFYGNFDFFTAADPTNGFVKFVDQSTAESTGLINSTSSGPVTWGVDSSNQAPDGRPSVRLTSKKSYNKGLVVLDLEHMPVGCGTWPAFWMVGPSWPNNGEIDILEGVNEQTNNAMTLHTGPGCALDTATGGFDGHIATSNCDVNAPNQDKNSGCSIQSNSDKSYGSGLNDNKGGVYATQWTDEAISVYFFPRGSVPEDALGDSPDPSTWGKPAAKFSGACDISSTFHDQQIVFDTTFCGDWAGNVWSSGSCASKADTCQNFVKDHPEAFKDAFWTINSLKVYKDNGNAVPSISATVAPSSTEAPVSSALSSDLPISTPIASVTDSAVLPSGTIPSESSLTPAPIPSSDMFSAVPPSVPASSAATGRHHHSRRPKSSATPAAVPTDGAASGSIVGESEDGVPQIPAGNAVQTVHQTVWVTVPGAAATPAPAARHARHAREHRRRLTQHHVRR